ncbi:hypothetical protein HPB51_006729 [Rhipicephalus microplus]|uniref:Uncharacterized protein n=1 Tax=Rhipicephalus microplus TaxID=6941 RepID=A0A9J6E7Z8_RHIMP|nr:hypothetical protein HPB51_006729 [Rhipicephalus microplus]
MVEIGTAQSQKTGDRAAREPDRFHLFLFMRPSRDVKSSTSHVRCSRHNIICKAITKKIHSLHPDAGISTNRLLVTNDVVRLRPDIVVELKNKMFILDVAVAWDARTEALEAMCT